MKRVEDITGKKYGKLTPLQCAGNNKHRQSIWLCQCDCGNKVKVQGNSLKSGNTRSCGCLQRRIAKEQGVNSVKHGYAKSGLASSGLYKSWSHMKQRCFNENSADYPNYGGRGITVCSNWMDFEGFKEWAKNNGYRNGLSIDRIDNNGNYEANNCRWTTVKVQNNNKRNNRLIRHNGRQMTLAQWSEKLGINYNTLYDRLCRGWSEDETLSTPVRGKRG